MTEYKPVKEDINFLEYPLWIVDSKKAITSYSYKNGDYQLSTGADRLPAKTDRVILYYLLSELQKQTNMKGRKVSVTRYQVINDILPAEHSNSKANYDRLMLSLNRWVKLTINFSGIFYENEKHTERIFHVIESVTIRPEDNKLEVTFNEDFIKQLRETSFTIYINFEIYKKLTRPITARLYEVLVKNFKGRNNWKIDITKLAAKLTLASYAPSHIHRQLEGAIKDINKLTELNIEYQYERDRKKDKKLCIFIDKGSKDSKLQSLVDMLPAEIQKMEKVEKLLKQYLKKKSFDYVSSNIEYHLKKARDKNSINHLTLCIKEDYAEELRAKNIVKQGNELKKKLDRERQLEREEITKKQEMLYYDTLKNFFAELTEEEKTYVHEEVENRISTTLFANQYKNYKEGKPSAMGHAIYEQEMYNLLAELKAKSDK